VEKIYAAILKAQASQIGEGNSTNVKEFAEKPTTTIEMITFFGGHERSCPLFSPMVEGQNAR
jgi:hypothetical protein